MENGIPTTKGHTSSQLPVVLGDTAHSQNWEEIQRAISRVVACYSSEFLLFFFFHKFWIVVYKQAKMESINFEMNSCL